MTRQAPWQLVLYGRTLRADSWWRVRPEDAEIAWLNALVTTTTSGGEDLRNEPRVLLARAGNRVLVGGAARVALLSERMNTDGGGRPLYCFVGWLSGPSDV